MKKLSENFQLLNSALTHFLGEHISQIDKFESDYIMFQTLKGITGFIEPNFMGNMDIWIGDIVVYEIEKNLFDLLEYDKKTLGLIEFYNILKTTDISELSNKSYDFYIILKTSTEKIIINNNNSNIPLIGDTLIESIQIHYTEQQKIKINLN